MSARGSWAIAAAGILVAGEARSEPRPMSLEYRAHEGCPSEDVFAEEITWRTPLVRIAKPADGTDIEVRAFIKQRGSMSRGQVSVWLGRAWITREITGSRCDEVVSALGLVTALAIDPRASTARKTIVAGPPPAPPPRAPIVLPREPPPPALPPIAPDLTATPLPAFPVALDRMSRLRIGARASIAIAPAPRPLFGGALFVARDIDPRLGASLRIAIDVASTGTFETGQGGASFLRVLARIDGCAFALRPAKWLSIVPCIGAEGGALRGSGVLGGPITKVQAATVPWFGLGLLPAVSIDLDGAVIEAQGGPVFPLIRREFLFETPDVVVHAVPPVTGTVSIGVSIAVP